MPFFLPTEPRNAVTSVCRPCGRCPLGRRLPSPRARARVLEQLIHRVRRGVRAGRVEAARGKAALRVWPVRTVPGRPLDVVVRGAVCEFLFPAGVGINFRCRSLCAQRRAARRYGRRPCGRCPSGRRPCQCQPRADDSMRKACEQRLTVRRRAVRVRSAFAVPCMQSHDALLNRSHEPSVPFSANECRKEHDKKPATDESMQSVLHASALCSQCLVCKAIAARSDPRPPMENRTNTHTHSPRWPTCRQAACLDRTGVSCPPRLRPACTPAQLLLAVPQVNETVPQCLSASPVALGLAGAGPAPKGWPLWASRVGRSPPTHPGTPAGGELPRQGEVGTQYVRWTLRRLHTMT